MVDKVQSIITLEDVMHFNDDEWIEVVDGELVKTDMSAAGFLQVIVVDNLYEILKPFARANKLGRVQTDGLTFILHVNENGVRNTRIADLSFIRRGRIPKNFNWSKPFSGAPDLAVEVISPTEPAEETLSKISDYLRFGTEQVWVVYPSQRQVYVHRSDQPDTVRVYKENDILEAETLFPGLKIKISDLFIIEED